MSINSKMTAIADEIRELSGTTAPMGLDAMASNLNTANGNVSTEADLIAQITTALEGKAGGDVEPELQSKTVTPSTNSQTVIADNGYDGLSEVIVNAMPTATQATPSISVNSSGLITASATQTAGYVSAGTKSGTKQLTTQAAQTITPGTSNKFITPGKYIIGNQTILGDSNLKAENIKSGVSIFGVAGNYEGSGGGSGGGGIKTCTATVKSVYGATVNLYATAVNENGDVFVFAKRLSQADPTVTFTAVCSTAMIIKTDTSSYLYRGYGFTEDPSLWDYARTALLLTTPNAGDAVYLECIDDM